MKRLKTQEKIDRDFEKKLRRYEKYHLREVESFANIPFGYGMRGYSRLKRSSDRSSEVREQMEEMVREFRISTILLSEAIRKRALSRSLVNEYQKTKF